MDSKKELEQIIDSLMQDDGLQAPSIGFTEKVVGKVVVNKPLSDKLYQPLLPKWSWYLMLLGVLGLLFFGWQQYTPSGNVVAYDHYLKLFGNWSSQFFSGIRFSKTLLYVVVVGGALTCLQTVVLKNYWNSKLS